MSRMMKPEFELKLAKLYQFFGLSMPEDSEFVDNCYKILRRFSAGAIEHAFDLFRENHGTIRRGENIAFALRQFAETWRDPETSGPGIRRASSLVCPFSCDNGLFYVVTPSARETGIAVLPCANCNPHMRTTATPESISSRGLRRISVIEAIGFQPHPTNRGEKPTLNSKQSEIYEKYKQHLNF